MDNKKIYDDYDWASFKISALRGKVQKVIETIPQEVETIIDIGCGNGVITNVLGKEYQVLGVDRSEKALKFVETEKLAASCDSIPIVDKKFDMVFSSELLEHLPDLVLENTVKEMARLTNKYILITVPNNENPDKLLIECPNCKYVFNSPHHLRSFTEEKLALLFPGFEIVNSFVYGLKVRYYNRKLLDVKRKWTPSESWIPYYWIKKDARKTTCPSCENIFEYNYRFNPISTTIDIMNVIISPKKPYWLFVLFEKK